MNNRVLAGGPQDMRWLPEGSARFPEEMAARGVPAAEKEPALEPQAAEDDLETASVSPGQLPPEPLEAPITPTNRQSPPPNALILPDPDGKSA